MPLSLASKSAAQRLHKGKPSALAQPNQGSMWSLSEVSKSEILAFISHCFSNVEKLIKGMATQHVILKNETLQQISLLSEELSAQQIMIGEVDEKVDLIFEAVIKDDHIGSGDTRSNLTVQVTDEGRSAIKHKAAHGEWQKAKYTGQSYSAFLTGLHVDAQAKEIMAAFEDSISFENISAISGKLRFKSKSAWEKALEQNGTKSGLFWKRKVVIKVWNPKPKQQRDTLPKANKAVTTKQQRVTQPKANKVATTKQVELRPVLQAAPSPVQPPFSAAGAPAPRIPAWGQRATANSSAITSGLSKQATAETSPTAPQAGAPNQSAAPQMTVAGDSAKEAAQAPIASLESNAKVTVSQEDLALVNSLDALQPALGVFAPSSGSTGAAAGGEGGGLGGEGGDAVLSPSASLESNASATDSLKADLAMTDALDATRPAPTEETPQVQSSQGPSAANAATATGHVSRGIISRGKRGGSGHAPSRPVAGEIPQPVSAQKQEEIRATYDFDASKGAWVLRHKCVTKVLNPLGLKPSCVPGCGLCQVRSLIADLKDIGDMIYISHKDLMDAGANFLQTCSTWKLKSLRNFIQDTQPEPLSNDWKENLLDHLTCHNNPAGDYVWGDDKTLAFYAYFLEVDIQQWDCADGSKFPLIPGGQGRNKKRAGHTLHLAFRHDKIHRAYDRDFRPLGFLDGHYDAVIHVGNGKASVPARR